MTYDSAIAAHYAAYRPALHSVILHKALGDAQFLHGLDVGCGTGASSVALTRWCDRVTGTDASADMVAVAKVHPTVRYLAMNGRAWPVEDKSVDVVTFAGVLPYLDRAATMAELRRVCRADAVVVTYDFAVALKPVLEALGVEAGDGGYDHAANFEGVDGVRVEASERWAVAFQVTPQEVAHLVLAGRSAHGALVKQYGQEGVFDAVRNRVRETTLDASLYFTRHTLM